MRAVGIGRAVRLGPLAASGLVAVSLLLGAVTASGQTASIGFAWQRQFYGAHDFVFGTSADATGVDAVGQRQCATGDICTGSEPFIQKYDAQGNLLWFDQFGTSISQQDEALGVATNGSAVYVVGRVTGTYQNSSMGTTAPTYNAFVRKYTADGQLVWSTQFGTIDQSGNHGPDSAIGVAVDATGVYVVGQVAGPLPDQTDSTTGGGFIRKYSPDGQVLWTHESGMIVTSVAVDATGAYLAGWGPNVGGGVVAKYFPDGTVAWDPATLIDACYQSCDGVSNKAVGIAVAGGHVYVAMQLDLRRGDAYASDCNQIQNSGPTLSFSSEIDVLQASDGTLFTPYTSPGYTPRHTSAGPYDSAQAIAVDTSSPSPTLYVAGLSDGTCQAFVQEFPTDPSSGMPLSPSAAAVFGPPNSSSFGGADNAAMSVTSAGSGTYVGGRVTCAASAFAAILGDSGFASCAEAAPPPPPASCSDSSSPLSANGPYSIPEGGTGTLTASGPDPVTCQTAYRWDLDNSGSFATPGQSVTLSAPNLDGPSSQAVTVRACNVNTGACNTSSATVNITNVPPTATFTATPASVATNGSFTLSLASPYDPSTADTAAGFTYAFDCGDGRGFSGYSASNTPTCTAPSTPGLITVQGKIQDKDTGVTSYTTTVMVTVTPSALTANAGGPYSIQEGSTVLLAGTGRDPDGDPLTYAWDLDDNGTYETTGQTASLTVDDGPSTHTVGLQVCDSTLDCATSTATVNVTNVPPKATFDHPNRVAVNASFSLSLTIPSDPSAADTAAGFTYRFDCGDGSGYGAFSASGTMTCTAPSTSGPITIKGEIQDKDGGVSEYTGTVIVGNRAPTANANGPYTIPEGSKAWMRASGSDPDGDSLTYAWDLDNNGTYETPGQTAPLTVDDGPSTHTVGLQVCDQPPDPITALCTTTTTTITITNVAPIGDFNVQVQSGGSLTLSITNPHDPSHADTAAGFTYAFACSDATNNASPPYGAFTSVSTSTCAFPAGTQVKVVGGKIQDKDGGVSTYVARVTVTSSGVSVEKDIVTDPSWKYSYTYQSGWERPGFDDSSWSPAIAPSGGLCAADSVPGIPGSSAMPVWGDNPQPFQTIYLRRDFSLAGLSSGTLQTSLSGDGDVYVNGTLTRHDADGTASGIFQDTIASLPSGQNVVAIKGVDVLGMCQWVEADLSVTTNVNPVDLIVSLYGQHQVLDCKSDNSAPCTTLISSSTPIAGTSATVGPFTPAGTAFDDKGNLYVTDFEGNRILKQDPSGAVTVVSDNTTLGHGHVFNSPQSIAFSWGYTRMYVSNDNRSGPNGGINIVDPSTGKGVGYLPIASSIGSSDFGPGGSGDSEGLAFDASNTLFMTNEGAAQGVMQVDQNTGDIAGSSSIPMPSQCGNSPQHTGDIAFDKDGSLWVANTKDVLEYSPSGTLLRSICSPTTPFSYAFALAASPNGGPLYVGDSFNGYIYSFAPDGTELGEWQAGPASTGQSVTGITIVSDPLPNHTPVITPSLSPQSTFNGWANASTTVAWDVHDPSGITTSSGCSGSTVTAETAGTTLTCSGTNGVGRTSSQSITIKIDKTAPTITAQLLDSSDKPIQPTSSGWFNQKVTVHFVCTDPANASNGTPGSGIAACPSDTTLGEGANQSVSGTAYDNAGNSAIATATVNIDLTPPSNVTGTPSRQPDSNGWYNHGFSVTWSGQDSLSGIANCSSVTYPGTVSPTDTASGSLSGTCTDQAGNQSAPVTLSFTYDATPPTVTCTTPAPTFVYGQSGATVSATVSDATSGPAQTLISTSASTSAVGSFSASLTGSDKAGNSKTQSCPSTVSKAITTTSLTSSATPSVSGQQATFTAAVAIQLPGAGTPTGMVDFYDGTTRLGSGTLALNSTTGLDQATFQTSILAVGGHSLTASYGGDGNVQGSASSVLMQYVDTNLSGYPTLSNGAYNLQNANLPGATLVGAPLANSSLGNATLTGANLMGANLSGANLTQAVLSNANLSGANLSNANLSQTNLSGANLSNATLGNANLTQTNLQGATGLSSATLTGVIWKNTTCPDGTNSSKDGGTCIGHL